MKRAVESAQGWAPFNTFGYAGVSRTAEIDDVAQLAARIAATRELAAEIGRTEPFDVCFSGAALADDRPVAARREDAERLGDAGVTWVAISLGGDDRAGMLDAVQRFGAEVIDGGAT